MLSREKAQQYLKDSLQNQRADFREDQYEAIDTVVNQRKKVLVVQKTGWGKSSVYFISTKFLREQGSGLTIIISPLLALMRNQIDSAKKLNLPFVEAIKKIKQNQAQKMMNNAYHQAKNLDGVFEVEDNIPDTPVLLIDDVIDSGWTVTVASALLKQKGSGEVFPASLATTGKM